jgi:hypothetical protein
MKKFIDTLTEEEKGKLTELFANELANMAAGRLSLFPRLQVHFAMKRAIKKFKTNNYE